MPLGHRALAFFPALLMMGAIAAALLACGGGGGNSASSGSTATDPSPPAALTAADVQKIVQNAAAAADAPTVIAVSDREGNVLATFFANGASRGSMATGNFGTQVDSEELAAALARTAAFFSNDMAPLSSRTVRFISGIHFPPGVSFTANADLYGIENTNRGCENLELASLHKFVTGIGTSLDGLHPGLGIITGKANTDDSDPVAVNPGGVPLFKAGHMVGGVGVVSLAGRMDIAEYAAFAAATGAGFLDPSALPAPGVVLIAGIELPFVNQTSRPGGVSGAPVPAASTISARDGIPPPQKYLLGPLPGSRLSRDEVNSIVMNAVNTANLTRAVIRLPQGSRTRMSIAVADLDGTLLAVYRMRDGTIFSLDVASTKARNVVWFSSPAGFNPYDPRPGASDLQDSQASGPGIPAGTAVTNRTLSFGSMPLFPPGIDQTAPGPFFKQLYLHDTAHPCTQGSQASNPHQSGIVFFPGSLPLYRNGQLVGGLGVSGDGVDQDDFVTAAGAKGYEADPAIRADQVVIRNVRMPYLKFPRNPTD
jgi:uncharacterized protein GlcG (DUF336 family)